MQLVHDKFIIIIIIIIIIITLRHASVFIRPTSCRRYKKIKENFALGGPTVHFLCYATALVSATIYTSISFICLYLLPDDGRMNNRSVSYTNNNKVLQCSFYVLLTVQHLDVSLVNDQLDALFFNVFVSTPLHVSSSKCSSSGGPTCINTPSGITQSSGWLSDRPARQSNTRLCYTRWCINTSWPSWWWALAARNM